MEKGYIYSIINNMNGNTYIGKHSSMDNKYFGSGVALKNAIAMYGKENFTKNILEECDLNIINDREIFWIKYYNTYEGVGYNLTPGGDGWIKGMKHSEEAISKMRQVQKNKIILPTTIAKIKQTLKTHFDSLTSEERSLKYGKGGRSQKGIKKKPFTIIHKERLSKGQTGKIKNQTNEHRLKIGRTRWVKVYMIKNGIIIKEFESMSKAAEFIKGSISEISKSCKDGITTVKGYTFKKINEQNL